jgi:putative membrane protein
MIVPALLAAFHYLALALGLGGVFARGRALRRLQRSPPDGEALAAVLRADSAWGLAAFLWLSTGLIRAFAGLEKASDFYLRNGFFHVKMTLFLAVFLLEILPMVTFIRWRAARAKGQTPSLDAVPRLIRISDVELVLVVLIPFAATLMARGVWLF